MTAKASYVFLPQAKSIHKYGKDENKKFGSKFNESPLDLDIVHHVSKPTRLRFGKISEDRRVIQSPASGLLPVKGRKKISMDTSLLSVTFLGMKGQRE